MQPLVWTISASDCTGRSGIQAELLTLNALGATGYSVVSAVTAQNSTSLNLIESVSSKLFSEQLDCLAKELPAKVIKIGLLASIEQVQILVAKLTAYKHNWATAPFVLYDPVAIVESQQDLVEPHIVEVIKSDLLPLVDLLIVNSSDVLALSGHALISGESLKPAAHQLIAMGCASVLIKGGKFPLLDNLALDYWRDGQREIALTSERLTNIKARGLGTILGTAIGATLAQGYFIEDALVIAKAYLNQQLKASSMLGGKGARAHGAWPTSPSDFPQVVFPESQVGYELDLPGSLEAGVGFPACDTTTLGLYPVLENVAWLEKVLQWGIKTVQLRIKDKPLPYVEEQIIAAIALGEKYNARVFINDYWQLAVKHQAYGVHLGQQDMQCADFPLIADAGLRLGLSTHGYYELLCAKQLQPSYIALGHIFPTQTKDMPSDPQGVARLSKYVALLEGTPSVAIGGITVQRASAVCATGVGSIAVVSAITQAPDPKAAIDHFERILQSSKAI